MALRLTMSSAPWPCRLNEGVETYMLTPDKDYGQLIRDNVKMYRPRHGGGYEILGGKEINENTVSSNPMNR